MKRGRDFGKLSSDEIVYIIPVPSQLRDLCGMEGKEIVRARGNGWLQGNSIFQKQHGRCTYELTETVTELTRSAQAHTMQNLSVEELRVLPPAKEVLSSDSSWDKESQFSSMGWHWVCQLHSRAGLTLRNRYPTWTGPHGLVWFERAGGNIKLCGKEDGGESGWNKLL